MSSHVYEHIGYKLEKIKITMAKKKLRGTSICLTDGRRLHSNHLKTSDLDKNIVRDHIKMFPFKEAIILETNQ